MCKHLRATRAEINLDNLSHNLAEAKKRTGTAAIMAVVKGNAYGHGMQGASRFLEEEGIDYFGVALLEEGIALRKAGIKTPILIMGCIQPGEAGEAVKHNLTLNLCSYETAVNLSRAAKKLGRKARVHVKVDSGQVRYGLNPAEVFDFIEGINGLGNIFVEGIFSYALDREKTDVFLELLKELAKRRFRFRLRHIASSKALFMNFGEDCYLDMLRLGIFLLGSGRDAAEHGTKPVFALKSRVAFSKKVPAGLSISYGADYRLRKDSNIAIAAAGYGDGIRKNLAGRAQVLIRGKRFPIAGIGMDTLIVDTGETCIRPGEEVQIIGRQGAEEITAYETAQKIAVGVNQLTGLIPDRVPRIFYRKQKAVYSQ